MVTKRGRSSSDAGREAVWSPLSLAHGCLRRCSRQSAVRASDDKAHPVAQVLTEDNEVKIGRENAEENDKHIKLVTDAAIVERVNRIGQEIAAVANKVPIPADVGQLPAQAVQLHVSSCRR